MFFVIIVIFIVVPIAEIAVLVKLAGIIQLGPTLLLIVFTAFLGVYLLRRQGIGSLLRAQRSLEQGRLPVEGVADAAGLMLAGAFLLTPGLITDSLGFALLVPAIRHGLAKIVFRRLAARGNFMFEAFVYDSSSDRDDDGFGFPGGGEGGRQGGDDPLKGGKIIEGEIVKPSRKGHDQDRKSPWKR